MNCCKPQPSCAPRAQWPNAHPAWSSGATRLTRRMTAAPERAYPSTAHPACFARLSPGPNPSPMRLVCRDRLGASSSNRTVLPPDPALHSPCGGFAAQLCRRRARDAGRAGHRRRPGPQAGARSCRCCRRQAVACGPAPARLRHADRPADGPADGLWRVAPVLAHVGEIDTGRKGRKTPPRGGPGATASG